MPVIKHETCSHCNKPAWHEQACFHDLGDTCWICRSCGNRRGGKRISLGDIHARPLGKIQTRNASSPVEIINIHNEGAKLEIVEGGSLPVSPDELVLFNAKMQPSGPLGEFRKACVRWIEGNTLGISFKTPLFESPEELVCVIKH